MDQELLGLDEAAKILGKDKRQILTYIKRGTPPLFPGPVQRVAATPLWTREQIKEFGRKKGWVVE